MEAVISKEALGAIVRVVFFVLLSLVALLIFGWALYPLGYLIAAAIGTFAAAAAANSISLRVFEKANLTAIGLNWKSGVSRTNLLLGLAAGTAAALFVLVAPLLLRMAAIERSEGGSWSSFFFLSFALLFGAAGEEMLFRGYAFQLLCARLGRMATVLPMAVIFGLAHTSNANVTTLGVVNTVGFGIVLGYAFLRSGDLWLPIGIHYGWNWVLPLFGVNLSGFTMKVTGWHMSWSASAGELWSGGAYGPEGSILTCGAIVGLTFFLHRAPVKQQEPLLLKQAPEA